MTPEDPGFYDILANPGMTFFRAMQREYGGDCCFVMRHDEGFALTPIHWNEVDDYLYGGEYDEVENEFESGGNFLF